MSRFSSHRSAGRRPSGASPGAASVPPRAGLTLLELTLAMAVLSVAIMALLSTVISSLRLQESTRERMKAYNAARALLERMRGEPFNEIFARYNADPSDDPGGPGTAPGNAFTVPALPAVSGGTVGRILFPTDPSGNLREDVDDPAMGMPGGRDLNGDGVIDAVSHGGDYELLPVRVLVEWDGANGRARVELNWLMTRK